MSVTTANVTVASPGRILVGEGTRAVAAIVSKRSPVALRWVLALSLPLLRWIPRATLRRRWRLARVVRRLHRFPPFGLFD